MKEALKEKESNKGLFLVPRAPKPPKVKVETYLSPTGQVVIRSEFSDRMEALTAAFMAEHQPAGPTENMLVRDMASCQCRAEYAIRLQAQQGVLENHKTLSTLLKYQTTNEVSFRRSLKMLKMVQKQRLRNGGGKPRLITPKITGEC